MPRRKPTYPPEFKKQMVELARSDPNKVPEQGAPNKVPHEPWTRTLERARTLERETERGVTGGVSGIRTPPGVETVRLNL